MREWRFKAKRTRRTRRRDSGACRVAARLRLDVRLAGGEPARLVARGQAVRRLAPGEDLGWLVR